MIALMDSSLVNIGSPLNGVGSHSNTITLCPLFAQNKAEYKPYNPAPIIILSNLCISIILINSTNTYYMLQYMINSKPIDRIHQFIITYINQSNLKSCIDHCNIVKSRTIGTKQYYCKNQNI